ncbi:nuclear RNA export factor 1-like isoform X2 [Schistocerca piceifrons]|uniref:nuclear RNA export factor 1-like isoform X2 n=1 Tax=Schistocerca piceifrons TaxID=274613 RepID=UPI001F5FA23A|nr:nuclear RNA export factor 1-like isoform X2 [Schistocerca piceifrons]
MGRKRKAKRLEDNQGIHPVTADLNHEMKSVKNVQSCGNNIHRPGTSVHSPATNVSFQQPIAPANPKKKKKPKQKTQVTGKNIQQLATQSAHTPMFQSLVPYPPSSVFAPFTSGGAGIAGNYMEVPMGKKKKKKPKRLKGIHPVTANFNHVMKSGKNGPSSGTNVCAQRPIVQQNPNKNQQVKPTNNTQPTGKNIRQLALKSAHTPVLQSKEKAQPPGKNFPQLASQSHHTPVMQSSVSCQNSSATVPSTSGAAGNAAAPKQGTDVDLTDDVIVVEYTKEVVLVDLTNDDTEEDSTKERTEVDSTNERSEVGSMNERTEVVNSNERTEVDSRNERTEVDSRNERTEVDSRNERTEVDSRNEVIEVDSMNAACLLTARPSILSDTKPDTWHKVTVKETVDDRIAVLNAINRHISPLRLIPYFFHMEDGHTTFLVNNCSTSLIALFKKNLKVPYMSTEIELKVQLHAKKMNLSAILQRIISKRLSSEKTVLDLSYLASIPEFQQVMYDPSDTSHLQQQLLKMAQEMAPNLVSLSLAGNELLSLKHLAGLFVKNSKWKSIKVIDVTDNKFKTFSELVIFKSLPVTELYLHKNPFCGNYREEQTYTSVVRANFPHLIKLDGTYVQSVLHLPQWRPNYILWSSHGNSAELADQFIEHFFTLYDSEDRTWLWDLYHEDAYFSLSSTYLPGQSTATSARLSSYLTECRNLLHKSNKQKLQAALCHGTESVLAKLEKLPRTQHDPYSFSVDLLHHSDTSAILTVTGVFREQNRIQDISPRHFMRTFVLVSLANNEYQIINDIMYVTNAATAEAEDAFRYMKPCTNQKKITPLKRITQVTECEKNSMIQEYSQITNMTIPWSRTCLNLAGWNLKEALEKFMELYKMGKIPAKRFNKSKTAAKF